jgi:hypothetical protein
VTDDAQGGPTYEWATHSEPDFLALQVPPVPVAVGGRAQDALKSLLLTRGFRAVTEGDELGLGASNGCLLTCTDPTTFELLVTIGPRVGASRMLLTGLDPAWVGRVVAAGHAGVLVVDSAVLSDGTTSREALRADVEAGGVLGALVPSSTPDPGQPDG